MYRACVRCGLARRVRHSCHHGQPAGVVRRLPYVHVLATAHVVYAHVTPPFGNPLGCRGERPLFVAPFSTELADV